MGIGTLSDIAVVNAPEAFADRLPQNGPSDALKVTTCGRCLLVGSPPAIEAALAQSATATKDDEPLLPAPQTVTGKEAYHLLLRIACGLDSENPGEYHILSQLKKAWGQWSDEHRLPGQSNRMDASARRVSGYMQEILSDAKYIRDTIIEPNYSYAAFFNVGESGRSALAAASLAGVDQNSTVLIINYHDEICKDIACAVGKANSHCAASIIVTNPNERKRIQQYNDLMQEKQRGLIQADITTMPFEQALSEGMARSHHVIVGIPAGPHPDLDRQIIAAWQQRPKHQGRIVVLAARESDKLWDKAGVADYISPAAVAARKAEINAELSAALDKAGKACQFAAEARGHALSAGKVHQVIRDSLGMQSEELPLVLDRLRGLQNRFKPDQYKSADR